MYPVGRTLEDVLASASPLRGEGLPGLGVPAFYNVVLVLDGDERFLLSGDTLRIWTDTEPLEPVTAATFEIDPGVVFRNQRIVGIEPDDVGDLVITLENRTTLQVGTSYGTSIEFVAHPGRDST